MVDDVNDIELMVRFVDKSVDFKFNFRKQLIDKSSDPKLWDMFEILNRKHLYRIRTPEDMTADVIFSEDRLDEAESLRKLEKLIRDFRDQDRKFDVRRLFGTPGKSMEES